jgi:hypothetical protein
MQEQQTIIGYWTGGGGEGLSTNKQISGTIEASRRSRFRIHSTGKRGDTLQQTVHLELPLELHLLTLLHERLAIGLGLHALLDRQ